MAGSSLRRRACALALGALALPIGCAHRTVEHADLGAAYDAVSRILDPALLAPDPLGALGDSLPHVRALAAVDSAWISDSTAFVHLHGGGTVSWSARGAPATPR